MKRRISSLDENYKLGHLSVFPHAKDSKFSLYEAKNNAETRLRQTLSMTGKYMILDDTSRFPESGLVKISAKTGMSEIISYARKIGNQLHMLQRGFSGYRQSSWPAGSKVSCPVMAEHQNALRDAIVRIQEKIGLEENPDPQSINGLLKSLENKWLSPKAIFRAYPKRGAVPFTVHFHNFSSGHGVRFLWDFGDGITTVEKNPTHTYTREGLYTVKLNMISASNAHGIAEKANYIEVNNDLDTSYFYASLTDGHSANSANDEIVATNFEFVDQSDGNIIERHWFFGDGKDMTVGNPNVHTASHVYEEPGSYKPSLLIRFEDDRMRRMFLSHELMVL